MVKKGFWSRKLGKVSLRSELEVVVATAKTES